MHAITWHNTHWRYYSRSGRIAALTADNRNVWARFRNEHLGDRRNRSALDAIERAVRQDDVAAT